MLIEYTETEGGRWYEKSIPMKLKELERVLREFTRRRSVLKHSFAIRDLQFNAIRLPDGRVWDVTFGMFRHEYLKQKFVFAGRKGKKFIELLLSEDRFFPTKEVLERVWGFTVVDSARVMVHKLRILTEPGLIINEVNVGYRLDRDVLKKYCFGINTPQGNF